jgi:hypothetical protein
VVHGKGPLMIRTASGQLLQRIFIGAPIDTSTMTKRLSVLFAAALFALAGCGGGDAEDPQVATLATDSPAATATGRPDVVAEYIETKRAWVACLRDRGIEVTDPDAKGRVEFVGDTRKLKADPAFAAAQKACNHLSRPVPKELEERPVVTAEEKEQRRRYAKCMRENGAPDFPDPGPDGYYPEPADGSPGWDQAAPGAIRAGRICEKEIYGITPGPGLG